jgi:uncharacterized protein (DUF305 family)
VKYLTLAASLALMLALPLTAAAQEAGHDAHAGHDMSGSESAATMAYMEANAKMHAGMDIPFTGDADVDFIRGMIAHHQGAIDMARVVLNHGKDAEVKKLAQEIIAAQEAEIAWMTDWLAKNGG